MAVPIGAEPDPATSPFGDGTAVAMVLVRTTGGPLDGMRHSLSAAEHSDGIWHTSGPEGISEYRWNGTDRDAAGRPVYQYAGPNPPE